MAVPHDCELDPTISARECDQCMREAAEWEYQERLDELNEEFGYR